MAAGEIQDAAPRRQRQQPRTALDLAHGPLIREHHRYTSKYVSPNGLTYQGLSVTRPRPPLYLRVTAASRPSAAPDHSRPGPLSSRKVAAVLKQFLEDWTDFDAAERSLAICLGLLTADTPPRQRALLAAGGAPV